MDDELNLIKRFEKWIEMKGYNSNNPIKLGVFLQIFH